MMITAYTDGRAKPNPGRGGWGVVLIGAEMQTLYGGSTDKATNNEMEVQAILVAVQQVPENTNLTVVTDSRNAQGWIAKGWECNNPRILKMVLQIKKEAHNKNLNLTVEWTPSHQSGMQEHAEYNRMADSLAKLGTET